jgi:hypothetical protein
VFARNASWLVTALLVLGCSVGSVSPSPENSGCCTYPPTAWPGGISQQQAEQRALALVPASGSSAPTVVWAGFGFYPFVPGGRPDRKPVWEVRLAGAIAAPTCVPGYLDRMPSTADPLCLDRDSDASVIVVVDFYDGSLVGWLH